MSVLDVLPATGGTVAPRLPIGRIIDISLELDANTYKMHTPDGFTRDAQFDIEVLKPYDADKGDGQIVRAVRMRLHAGSHVDAPAHQLPTGKLINEIPLERFIGDALVLNFTDKVPGMAVTVEDLDQRYGKKIRRGDRVLLRTDVNKTYLASELRDWKKRSPAFTPEARHWLIEKGVSMVGFDCHHGAKPQGETRNTSKIFPTAGVLTLPYLNNLDQIKEERVTLVCFPLAMVNVEATPVRAIVIE